MPYKAIVVLGMTALSFFYAMEQHDLKPWVKRASKVSIEVGLSRYVTINIREKTTIAHIKAILHGKYQAPPADQQALYAAWWTSFWLKQKRSEKVLDNQSYVKQVMNTYNTDTLIMCLDLN